LFDVWNL